MASERQEVGKAGDYVGHYRVWFHCSCGNAKRFEAEDLVALVGAACPNRRLVELARCIRCGRRAQGLLLEPKQAHGYVETFTYSPAPTR
jgi:hypothetical protein